MVYQWLNNTLSRWLPQGCVLCGQNSHNLALCRQCREDLPRLRDACCHQCGLPLPAGVVSPVCGQCQQYPPAYDRVVGALAYTSPVAELVTGLKFHQRIQLARLLGELLAARVQSMGHHVQAILPVPLHPRRVTERGYNQALEIARPLARILDLPVLTDAVSRHRHTAAQSAQPPGRRQGNIRGAFALNAAPPVHRLALVDDVMTSGHTVNEVAGLLRRAGVEHIEVWCVARAWPHQH